MTGVIKSNRCGTCRKRKVKCDEVKPVCGPCLKSARACEDPISKVKFAKPKGVNVKQMQHETPADDTQASLAPCSDMAILRSATKRGGSFQTLRLAHYMRPRGVGNASGRAKPVAFSMVPTLSPIEKLQVALLDTFECLNPGLRLSLISDYVLQVPSRLGHCAALDDSMACLLNAHDALCRGNELCNSNTQANLYARALLSLQAALKDPVEAYSDNTLCAVTVMSYVEILGAGFQGPEGIKYVQHAGGAVKLVQARGPSSVTNNFSKILFANTIGISVVNAILHGDDCFLTEPQWAEVCLDEFKTSMASKFALDLGLYCIRIPTLIKQFRGLHFSSHPDEYSAIVHYGYQLRAEMQEIENYINSKMEDGSSIVKIPSPRGDALFPIVYHFADRGLTVLCTLFWGFSIILDTIIARSLDPSSSADDQATLRNRCINFRQQICMSFETCLPIWPLGSFFLVAPLSMAHGGATEEEKEWIMHSIWTLTSHIPHHKRSWGRLGLNISAGFFFGDPIYTVPTRAMGKAETDEYFDTWRKNARIFNGDLDA